MRGEARSYQPAARLATGTSYRYGPDVAKRLRVTFDQPIGALRVDEDGQPRPCASGVHWVNVDTLKTLAKRRIRRTDAKGRPLDSDATGNGSRS